MGIPLRHQEPVNWIAQQPVLRSRLDLGATDVRPPTGSCRGPGQDRPARGPQAANGGSTPKGEAPGGCAHILPERDPGANADAHRPAYGIRANKTKMKTVL